MKDKYKKENLEPIIKISRNWSEVLIKLDMSVHGNSRTTLIKYCRLYNINISHFETTKERYLRVNSEIGKLKRIPIDNILVENSTYTNTNHLKLRLYDEGLKERKCELCGQTEIWNGKHMSLILDHINGINTDNRFENLRIVCPNCNATLPTHCRGDKLLKKENKKKRYGLNSLTKAQIKNSIIQRKVNRPQYNQLLDEIKELGYSGTGRKYGVSDNTIRKWQKFYENFKI